MLLQHATIQEIAERAKVSTATVSRILNGKSGHRSATVEAVRRVTAELERNPPAKDSAVRLPECVGIIMATFTDCLNTSYISTLASAMVETLAAEGYLVQILPRTPRMPMDKDFLLALVERYHIKGFIIPEFDTLYDLSRLLDTLEIPFVSVGNAAGLNLKYNLCVDDLAGGREAVNYLWGMGHRRLGFMGMHLGDNGQRQRLEGFREGLRALGGDADGLWVKEFRGLEESATLAALELIRLPDGSRPTALFSANSFMTQKMIAELHRLGAEVPRDFSMLSYEENQELLHWPTPVSSMAQPVREMGVRTVNLLIRLLRGMRVEPHQCLGCALHVRGSVRDLREAVAERNVSL